MSFIRLLAAAVILGPTFLLAADRPPNVVVIFCDDLGYGDIGPFGSAIDTPNLDRMAAEGRTFTDFYAAQAVCSASRAALLTGCYPNRVGILGALGPGAKAGINPEETTVAEQAVAAPARELVAHEQRHVRHGVRHVEEERLVAVLFDEPDGPLGVPCRQVPLVLRRHLRVDDSVSVRVPFPERQIRKPSLPFGSAARQVHDLRVQRPHVVRVGQPEVLVEAVRRRPERLRVAEVPLPVDCRRIALRLQ